MSRQIIQQNHQNLVAVLTHVRSKTFDKDVRDMANRMIERIGGCTSSKLVGISADRGLPFVGYAKDGDLYDLATRKVAPIDRFYVKYVTKDGVTQTMRDKFVAHVTAAGKYLGYYIPDAPMDDDDDC